MPISLRPSDHIESVDPPPDINQPRLGTVGWLRWIWRQLTSMRTALFLLLLLAVAAVPGSLVPQTGADPNGVVQYKIDHPQLYPILNSLQVFDTYTSVWFSAIYLLLFISLIGCVIPRTKHHLDALRAKPPHTPARLNRMPGFRVWMTDAAPDAAIERARGLLKSSGYRVVTFDKPGEASVSAERGYLRETGNLVFHIALLGVLFAVGVGGGFGFVGQRVITTGQTFVNTLVNYDSFNPGRFVNTASLSPYSITLDGLDVIYDKARGEPLDYSAHVTSKIPGQKTEKHTIKVNEPLEIGGTNVYLLGNGYAPVVTIKDPQGHIVSREATPFLPQDKNLTSQGVIKVPDGLKQQLGIVGIFRPTAAKTMANGPVSTYPGLENPKLSLTVFSGNLGLDNGDPVSVYALNVDKLKQIAGPSAASPGLDLKPGQSAQLPDGLGSVTFDGVHRFASLDVHHDPTQVWVLLFAMCILAGLLASLFVPRRRIWVKAITRPDGGIRVEYAGLARGDDPGLDAAVEAFAAKHQAALGTASLETERRLTP